MKNLQAPKRNDDNKQANIKVINLRATTTTNKVAAEGAKVKTTELS